ncbi:MAG TPA: PAS domain-containing protein [Gaiellaceae bacterium]|nr:PAS domain-containing protein [Gaiellaceae bacterium]
MSVAEPLVQAGLLGEAIDRAPDAVLVADESMRYLAVNQAACRLLGYTREELLSLRIDDVATQPGSAAEYDEMMAQRSKTGTAVLRRKDGTAIPTCYRAHETKLAGMTVYVAIIWPEATVDD